MNSTVLFVGYVLGLMFGPLISIWSVNTLFALNIEYNFTTWFAALWLTVLIANKYKPE